MLATSSYHKTDTGCYCFARYFKETFHDWWDGNKHILSPPRSSGGIVFAFYFLSEVSRFLIVAVNLAT